jgi:hypothetical protein
MRVAAASPEQDRPPTAVQKGRIRLLPPGSHKVGDNLDIGELLFD